jgi:predicted NUDIX family NTP pyrophosphohydrolase
MLWFFLVHPGGPFFKNKDDGVWSIPKGLPEKDENDLLSTAIREFNEETGIVTSPPYHRLTSIIQKSGKTVHAWTFLGEWDEATGIISNSFELEWPPRSGKIQHFPEQDKGAWLSLEGALQAINPAQIPFLYEAIKIYNR